MMKESWKSVVGWPEHEVSDGGKIRRNPKAALLPGHVLRQYDGGHGYRSVHVVVLVHRIVAEAFLGPRPTGFVVNHKNGRKADNRAGNLEWVSRSENQDHAIANGLATRGEKHGGARLTNKQVRAIRRQYRGRWGEQTQLAKRYGVSQALIGQIVRRECWTHLDQSDRPQAYDPEAGIAKGASSIGAGRRLRSGEAHGRAKLTNEDVREIRRLHEEGVGRDTLARSYRVAVSTIRDIVRGRRWKHLE